MFKLSVSAEKENDIMAKLSGPIGVIDSGIGGLTVVRELQKILPGEDIIYFGDSANCPYGNRSKEQIIQLSKKMLQFLGNNGVKVTAIACNTISTLIDALAPSFDYKIIGIVSPAAEYVSDSGIECVGLIATEFTVSTNRYNELILSKNPAVEIISQGSPMLTALIERGDFDRNDINAEIRTQIERILCRKKVKHLILGCTHYPIAAENFAECYPDITLINPALEQAKAIKAYLEEADHSFSSKEHGKFTLCTSGDPEICLNTVKRLGIAAPDECRVITL